MKESDKAEGLKKVLDLYWPVIEHARALRAHYMGQNKHGVPLVAPDVAGALIQALNEAEKECNVVRRTDEANSKES